MRPNSVRFLFALALVGCSNAPASAPQTPVLISQPPPTPQGLPMAGAAALPPVVQQPVQPIDPNQPAVDPNQPADPLQPTDPQTTPTDPAMDPAPAGPMMAMDECGLNTGWDGDEYCILPPPQDQGFQIHVGPSNYDNPEAQYIMQPGTETTVSIPATSGNTTSQYYYFRQYRMRPGSHHVIVYAGAIAGKRLGGSQNLAKDNPEFGIIAPENQGVGMQLAANTPLNLSLHYYNFTDKPIIKEVWINFWYRKASDVTEPANEVFSMSPMNVAPGQHVLIHGSCPISGTGRALTLYGHVHANNQRFSAWRTRAGHKDLVFEMYDWEHPYLGEYSSTVTNPMPDPVAKTDGAWSGILDLMPGDNLEFECDIVNNTTNTFRGANEAKNDEMCILIGDTAGTTVPALCSYQTIPQ